LPSGHNPNATRVVLFGEEQVAQAALMVVDRIKGMSIPDIAKKYKVNPQTVRRRMRLARREKLLDRAADKVVRLVDKALGAYEASLDQDEDKKVRLEAARDVAFGTGVLSKSNKAAVNPEEKGKMTLRAWREKKFATHYDTNATKLIDSDTPWLASGEPTGETGTVIETGVFELTAELPEGGETPYLPFDFGDGLSPREGITHVEEDEEGI
jgi:transposase-like protein